MPNLTEIETAQIADLIDTRTKEAALEVQNYYQEHLSGVLNEISEAAGFTELGDLPGLIEHIRDQGDLAADCDEEDDDVSAVTVRMLVDYTIAIDEDTGVTVDNVADVAYSRVEAILKASVLDVKIELYDEWPSC